VSASGQPVSAEALQQAIIAGGANAARKWSIVPAGDGRTLRGTCIVRAHTVVAEIVPWRSTTGWISWSARSTPR
jgi:hypothetical protein